MLVMQVCSTTGWKLTCGSFSAISDVRLHQAASEHKVVGRGGVVAAGPVPHQRVIAILLRTRAAGGPSGSCAMASSSL